MADLNGRTEEDANVKERAKWSGGLQFLMSCIAASVGLGNVWRFPYTAYENGGGAFLIPYIIVLFVVGKPFYYLEALLGQFSSTSCVRIWSICPAMRGIGYGQIIAGFCVLTYYCSLMAIILFYLIASFQSELPWAMCRPEWGPSCYDSGGASNATGTPGSGTLQSSAELYFLKVVLKELDSIEDGIGLPSWQLSFCLAISWLCIFAILYRGVRSSGKFSYFLAIFPYVVLIGLLARAVTLPGSINGILFFITPDWSKIWEPSVWYSAITQCFFSLSVCFGAISMYSSYNDFSHNIARDVMIVTTLDTFTSLIAGCTIFGILGNLAHEMKIDNVGAIARSGIGIAFVSYPEALARFDTLPQFFAVVFFVMMFVLGAGSAVALAAAPFSVLSDAFPKIQPSIMISAVAIAGFSIGLVYVTPGGQWVLTIVDYYGGTFVAIIVGVAQLCTVFWIYGLRNFLNDVEFMIGHRPGLYWRVCWLIITPGLMLTILIYTFASYKPPTHNTTAFPRSAHAAGWTLLGIAVTQLICTVVYELIRKRGSTIAQAFDQAFRPSLIWGPSDPKYRQKWKAFVRMKEESASRGVYDLFFK